MNDSLKDQLQKALKEGKLKVKYPKGHKQWRTKFDYFYNITKSVEYTLKIMYGPEGSATNYKGSLYNNSNFNIKSIKNKKIKRVNKSSKHSSVFDYLKNKPNGKH